MGGRLRVEEIRQKRVAAREAARADRIGTELATRIPCAHGHERGCLLYFAARVDGSLIHVSSDCTRRPPPSVEVAVMKGLLETTYRTCGETVATIKGAMAAISQGRKEARDANALLPFDENEQPVLWHAVQAAREAARRRVKARPSPENFPFVELDAALKRAVQDRAVRSVPLPAGWAARLEVSNDLRTTVVSLRTYRWGGWYSVGQFRAGGFVIKEHPLLRLVRSYNADAYRDYKGKKPCTVCGKRITSPSAHVRTQRHRANVEEAVWTALEAIGNELIRKDWRARRQTEDTSGNT